MKFFCSVWSCLFGMMLLVGVGARAQAPAWQLASGSSGTGQIHENGTAADANGNVYLAGEFSGTVSFGSTTLTSTGRYDGYVAKWNNSLGRFEWAVKAGGGDEEEVTGVAVNGSSIYIAGRTKSTAAIFGSHTLTGPSAYRAYVAKIADLGATGTFGWAQQVTGSISAAADIAAVGSSIYITGNYGGGPVAFGSTTLASGSGNAYNFYVAKLTDAGSSGSFAWVKGNTAANTTIYYCSLAAQGNSVYVTGGFSSNSLPFGPDTLRTAATDACNVFVAKLTDAGTSGAFVWARQGGNPTALDLPYSIAATATGVYVTGYFNGSGAQFGTTTLNSMGGSDIFVAKLTDSGPSGSFAWAVSAGGPSANYDSADGVVARGNNVYITGSVPNTTATFGPFTITGPSNTPTIYLAKLLDAGATASFAWVQQGYGSPGIGANTIGQTLALSGSTVFMGGVDVGPLTFGSLVVPSTTRISISYVAALTDPALASATSSPAALGFAVAPNPAHATAVFTASAALGTGPVRLALVDALGRVVRTYSLNLPATGLRHELALAGLAPGLYALQVAAGGSTATRRLVVE